MYPIWAIKATLKLILEPIFRSGSSPVILRAPSGG